MEEATQGRLYNSGLVLSPESGCASTPRRGNADPGQENNDILEFLIKTEMEDAASAEAAEADGVVHSDAPPSEGVPMGWRRMSECSYKSRPASPSVGLSSSLRLLSLCFGFHFTASFESNVRQKLYLRPLFVVCCLCNSSPRRQGETNPRRRLTPGPLVDSDGGGNREDDQTPSGQ